LGLAVSEALWKGKSVIAGDRLGSACRRLAVVQLGRRREDAVDDLGRYNTAVPTPFFDDAAIACAAPDTRHTPSALPFLTDVGSPPDMHEGDLPDMMFAS